MSDRYDEQRPRHPAPAIRGPHVTMHEDDTLSGARYPSILNRRNIARAKSVFAALTIALILYQQYLIIESRGKSAELVQKLACLVVRNHPDSDAQDYAILRDRYDCPKYDPKKIVLPPGVRTTQPARSHSSSRARPTRRPRAIGAPSPTRNTGVLPDRPVPTPSASVVTRTTSTRVVVTKTAPTPSLSTVTHTTTPPILPPLPPLLCKPLGLPVRLVC